MSEGQPRGQLSGVPVVWSPDCLRHDPESEIWLGVRWPATEVAERVTEVVRATTEAGADLLTVQDADLAAALDRLADVHDPGLIRHLREVAGQWQAAGLPALSGQSRVVPYVFPTAGMLGGLPGREPFAVHARAGLWCYDTMTLVGPGTWPAAHAAAAVSARAAALVAGGASLALAAVRPPGHHVTRSAYGGSCYLNNAAVAVAELRSAGVGRVAVVDIDAHHGNGTQQIFYRSADTFYGSVHVDPGAGWFPHYVGFADETGTGPGVGTNLNLPVAPGTGDDGWLAAVRLLVEAVDDFDPEVLVLSLGVDAEAGDPESPLEVTIEGYRQAGRLIGGLGPVVAVQEGGYRLESIGPLIVATLDGLVSGPGTFPP